MSNTEFSFDFVGEYREGLAFVRNNPEEFRVGFIDESGKLVIPLDYYGRVTVDGRERFIHHPFFSEGLTAVMDQSGSFGYLDAENRTVIPFVFEDARPFSSGLAAVKLHGKYGFIDRKGQFVVQPFFDSAGEFAALAPVRNGDQVGYINTAGALVIPFSSCGPNA